MADEALAWKVGDWVVLDMDVGQIVELQLNGSAMFSDGWFRAGTSCERFRPLTLANKRIAESFASAYKALDKIDGHAGFNYPDISRYFADLSIKAIDAGGGDASRPFFDAAQEFLREAGAYKPIINGVRLFRRVT